MLITETIDVAIGLTLIYLLLSITMTAVSEAIEGFLKKRAVDLERAIGELLQGEDAAVRDFYKHPLITALYPGVYATVQEIRTNNWWGRLKSWASKLQNREPSATTDAAGAVRPPLRWLGRNLPSYIPRDAFSAVIMNLYQSGGTTDQLKKALDILSEQAGGDTAKLRASIESWYDGAMDRASGWFKRRTQGRLFWMGLVLAVLANVNSVTIANYLAHAPEARKTAVIIASNAANKAPGWLTNDATPDMNSAATPRGNSQSGAPSNEQEQRRQYLSDYTNQLMQIGVPVGWSSQATEAVLAGFPPQVDPRYGLHWFLAALLVAFGYIATALAVMLGAPFWFDMLDKLIVVRSTVKPSEKSSNEASKGATS